ncbi:hypothetical protein JCM19241_2548 [Vibrio ishigakensis]|uniref:Uncharacterized protein n=1 Tax=Vibrio ishigakensis TaxID=1481914 RepID=A0A0B8QD22_9VIBR|nr:hypothetical protein JCM19241_2548 [Vibrio ishigakensis]
MKSLGFSEKNDYLSMVMTFYNDFRVREVVGGNKLINIIFYQG